MEEKRIDLTQFEDIREDWLYQEVKDPGNSEYATVNGGEFSEILFFIDRAGISEAELKALTMVPDLIAELKRMYEREDALVSAIKELYYSEDNTGCSEDLTVVSLVAVLKLRDLTSE